MAALSWNVLTFRAGKGCPYGWPVLRILHKWLAFSWQTLVLWDNLTSLIKTLWRLKLALENREVMNSYQALEWLNLLLFILVNSTAQFFIQMILQMIWRSDKNFLGLNFMGGNCQWFSWQLACQGLWVMRNCQWLEVRTVRQ